MRINVDSVYSNILSWLTFLVIASFSTTAGLMLAHLNGPHDQSIIYLFLYFDVFNIDLRTKVFWGEITEFFFTTEVELNVCWLPGLNVYFVRVAHRGKLRY